MRKRSDDRSCVGLAVSDDINGANGAEFLSAMRVAWGAKSVAPFDHYLDRTCH